MNSRDKNDSTALLNASHHEYYSKDKIQKVVDFLVAGAEPDAKDASSRTPAIVRGHDLLFWRCSL